MRGDKSVFPHQLSILAYDTATLHQVELKGSSVSFRVAFEGDKQRLPESALVRLVHAEKDGVVLYATKYNVDQSTRTLTFNDILPSANQSASTVKGEYKVMILVNDSTLQKSVRKKAGQVTVEHGVDTPAKANEFSSRGFYAMGETIE